MPTGSGQSSLFGAQAAQLAKALAAGKGKPHKEAGGGLPAGIEAGIAELRDCHIGTYKDGPNKGKPFFMAAGVVLSPTHHDGTKIAGERTQVGPEPLCDTPAAKGQRKTFQDHYDWMRDILYYLGLDIDQFSGLQPAAAEQAILAGIKTLAHPVDPAKRTKFKFRTWKGQVTKEFPNPRVQHQWNGKTEWNGQVEAGGGFKDDTPPAEPGDAPPAPEFNEFSENGDGQVEEPQADGAEAPAEVDLDALAAACYDAEGASDEELAASQEARNELLRLAMEAGIEQGPDEEAPADTFNGAESFEAVVAMIRERQAPAEELVGEAPEPEPEPPPPPAKKPPAKPPVKTAQATAKVHKPPVKPAAPAKPAAKPAAKPVAKKK
jgi:hypothetical protein